MHFLYQALAYVSRQHKIVCVIYTLCLSLTNKCSYGITSLMNNPDRIYRQIGVAIRIKRKSLSLTQHMLAAQLGISRAALANIETGRQKVFVHHLYTLAAALEMKPHELLPLFAGVEATNSVELPLPEDLKPEQRNQITDLVAGIEFDAARKKGGRP